MTYTHQALFGGKGTVTVNDLIGRAHRGAFTAILECSLEPHGSVGRHQQEHEDELIIGLAGDGIALVNGQPSPLRCGAVVWLAKGSVLALQNSGDELLRYLIVKARPI